MNAFSWAFLAALAAATLTRLWLARRQVAHVRAHRDAVPPDFATSIPLAAHQKAADYTVAKVRLGAVEMGLDCLRRHLKGLPVQERIDFEKVEETGEATTRKS